MKNDADSDLGVYTLQRFPDFLDTNELNDVDDDSGFYTIQHLPDDLDICFLGHIP